MGCLKAKVLLQTSSALGEGPVWDGDAIWYVDILGRKIGKVDLLADGSAGDHRVFILERMPGCLVPKKGGGFLAAAEQSLYEFFPDSGTLVPAPVSLDIGKDLRFNDGACDPRGRFIVGTMDTKGRKHRGSLYMLDHDWRFSCLLDGVSISNGLAWSAEGDVLYYVDTPTSSVQAFTYDLDKGALVDRRTAFLIAPDEGLPDGMAIDRDGNLWIALWGGWGVGCWNPVTGKQLCRIDVPVAHVTSCCFCGPDLELLCITTSKAYHDDEKFGPAPSAGDLFICSPGTSGLMPMEYIEKVT